MDVLLPFKFKVEVIVAFAMISVESILHLIFRGVRHRNEVDLCTLAEELALRPRTSPGTVLLVLILKRRKVHFQHADLILAFKTRVRRTLSTRILRPRRTQQTKMVKLVLMAQIEILHSEKPLHG